MTWVDGEKITAAKLNAWMPTTATNSYAYLLLVNGAVYEGYDPNGLLVYGGAFDAGGVDGADSTAVFNAAMAAVTAATGGTIIIKGTRATPYPITGVDTVTADCGVIGVGEVDWTTTIAGVSDLTIGSRSRLENIFVHHNSLYKHITLWTEQMQFADRYWTNFPSAAGVITSTPDFVLDGNLTFEGAGKITSVTHVWIWDTGSAAPKCMLGPEDVDTLSIKNIADTAYKNLKLAMLYFPLTDGYILPLADLYIQTPELDATSIYIKGWDGSAQLTVARVLSDAVGNNPTFQIARGYLTGDLNLNSQYLDWFPKAATCTEANKAYIKIKVDGAVKRVPYYDDA